MAVTIFAVTTHIPDGCNDGRDAAVFWGHEKQYHASRESAEAACRRLQEAHGIGCDDPPGYAVEELSRAGFESGPIGDHEWRVACKQAGVDPVTGAVRASRA